MPSSHWPKISWKPTALASRILPPTLLEFFIKATSQHHDVPPLNFPEVPSRLPQLLGLGLGQNYVDSVCTHFANAVQKLDETLLGLYYADAPQLCENAHPRIARSTCIEAFQHHLLLRRAEAIERLSSILLSQAQHVAQQARSIDNTSPASTSSLSTNGAPSGKRKRQGRPSTFTPEQTFALNALLARDDKYSSEEKDAIAQELNLTRDQVNRWFCNARARKATGARPAIRSASSASIRTVSSDFTSTESSYQTDQGAATPLSTNLTPELNNSCPGFINSSTGFTNPTPEADSLDFYLDYSACLEPEQSSSDLPHNLPSQHDQITSWSENVNMTVPAFSSSSSVESQVATTSVPLDPLLCPEPLKWATSLNTPLFDSLDFDPVQSLLRLPSAPESSPSNDVPPGLDLSEW